MILFWPNVLLKKGCSGSCCSCCSRSCSPLLVAQSITTGYVNCSGRNVVFVSSWPLGLRWCSVFFPPLQHFFCCPGMLCSFAKAVVSNDENKLIRSRKWKPAATLQPHHPPSRMDPRPAARSSSHFGACEAIPARAPVGRQGPSEGRHHGVTELSN